MDPARAENTLAVLDAIARYAHAADSRSSNAWSELFTEDGCLELYAPHDERPNAIFEGRATIRSYVERQNARQGGLRTRHIQSNTAFVSIDDHHAETVTEFMILLKAPDGDPTLVASGVYEDRWRRTPSGWQITRRVVRAD
jgi:3-phenylpropionate/cinnamic acid dioxygenase small subunit